MEAQSKYPHVFKPLSIGKVSLRNRIFLPAHTTNFAEKFMPNDRHLHYLRERARGGVSLVFLEPLRVHRTSLGRAGGLSGDNRAAIPQLQKITDAVRKEGAHVFTQVTHTGRHSDNFMERLPAWGPSPVPWTSSGEIPHAMTRSEMDEVREAYIRTARLAIEAGFEGMEIHFGHGHLLHQYLSPACNFREDDYGGSFENRIRYPFEILDAVFDAVGDKAEVGVRVSVADLMHGGMTTHESLEVIKQAAARPSCAFIHASVAAYHWPSIGHHVADMSYPHHPYLEETLQLRDVIGETPLLTVNRYTSLADCEEALSTGKIDMVGMNRAHMADPSIIAKTLAGQEDNIRPCISSNHCIGQIAFHRPIACMMNPRVGKEQEWPEEFDHVAEPKKILVVGGGPAGLEAATVASKRGHAVTLWEASDTLGGKLVVGGLGHRRGDLNRMRDFLIGQLRQTNTAVALNKKASAQDVADFGADLVVLAVGAQDERLPKGMTGTIEEALLATDRDWRARTVAIYDKSGSWATMSAAETLAARGAHVSVFSAPDSPFWDVHIYSRMTALERLEQQAVKLRPGHLIQSIDQGHLRVRNKFSGEEQVYGPFDEVLFASRGAGAFILQSDLERLGVPVAVVGDARAPHSLFEAIYDAHDIARIA